MPGALKCSSAKACAEVLMLLNACAHGVEAMKLRRAAQKPIATSWSFLSFFSTINKNIQNRSFLRLVYNLSNDKVSVNKYRVLEKY